MTKGNWHKWKDPSYIRSVLWSGLTDEQRDEAIKRRDAARMDETPEPDPLSLKHWIKVARRDTAHTVAAALYVLVALGSIPLVAYLTLALYSIEDGERYYSFIAGLIITAGLAFIAHLLIKNLVLAFSDSYSEELARQQERRVSEREAYEESLWKPLPEVVCTHCGIKGQVEAHEFPPEDGSDGLTNAILSKFKLFGDAEMEAANKRQRLRSQPNLRCKNCTVAWKDSSLSWKEPNPE